MGREVKTHIDTHGLRIAFLVITPGDEQRTNKRTSGRTRTALLPFTPSFQVSGVWIVDYVCVGSIGERGFYLSIFLSLHPRPVLTPLNANREVK